jgi:hypothetical protein
MRRCFQCSRCFEGTLEERDYNAHLVSQEHKDNRNKKLSADEQALIDKYN